MSPGDHLELTWDHCEQVQLAWLHLLYCMMGQVSQETDVWKASYIPENLREEKFNITQWGRGCILLVKLTYGAG